MLPHCLGTYQEIFLSFAPPVVADPSQNVMMLWWSKTACWIEIQTLGSVDPGSNSSLGNLELCGLKQVA